MKICKYLNLGAYLIAFVLGLSFALNSAWMGTKILNGSLADVLTGYAISPMTPDLPVEIFIGLTPLFAFIFWFGGIFVQELETYAVFIFTRSKKPGLLFIKKAWTILINMVLYLSLYYLGQVLIFELHGIKQTGLSGIPEALSAIALQIPLYYLLSIITNWISLHIGKMKSMILCTGLVLLFLLISYIGYESRCDILFSLSPISNSFLKWYNIEIMGWIPQYFNSKFSTIYWVISITFTLILFYNDYVKIDICFGVDE